MNPFRQKKRKDGRSNNRPPSKYQFKPGQSGNKKGRPKATPTVLDIAEEELNSMHSMTAGNRQIRVPMKRLIIKQLFRVAMKGNTKALSLVLEMLDTIQKTSAKRHADSLRPRITNEDLKGKTQDELTALYFETLKVVRGGDDEEDESSE